ncbi:MAG: class I SAM-dependent methyltransferase [Chitinophagales bacterium]|nr:class I SAM-dependent methyltransferase [Chitinophagales bacterium]
MRNFSHLTPRYIFNRVKLYNYYRKNADKPWLTKTAIEFLDNYLKPTDVGVEFGSGRSTLWFASKLKKLYSIEGDKRWYDKIQKSILGNNVANVDYRYIDHQNENPENFKNYILVFDEIDIQVDFILVDGIYRSETALEAVDRLASGGNPRNR